MDKMPLMINEKQMGSATVISPILVNCREAARMLSISERTLWGLTASHEIPSLRIGRSVRYRVADLHNWVEQQMLSPKA